MTWIVFTSYKETYPEIPMTMLGFSVPSLIMHQFSDEVRSRHSSISNCFRIGTPFIRTIFINGSAACPTCRVAIPSSFTQTFYSLVINVTSWQLFSWCNGPYKTNYFFPYNLFSCVLNNNIKGSTIDVCNKDNTSKKDDLLSTL